MNALRPLAGLGLLAFGLGLGGCKGGEPLTPAQCERIADHVSGVMPNRDRNEELKQCLAGETWNSIGYECALKAYFRAAISSCLMKQR